ncbi:calexcitin-2-like isoform X2 [Lineus longissimus]|uniref:calexcitin-2-like isoform X2 n=1 Tax=Lineus longissimus TaxID=88925 RepID=UPI002B4CE0CE
MGNTQCGVRKRDFKLSQFRRAKILSEFHSLFDITQDGELDWADFNQARQEICEMSGWSPSSKNYVETQDMFVKIWRSLQKKADSDLNEKINKDEWVAMWEAYGKEQFDENELAKKEKRQPKNMFPDWLEKYIEYKFRLYDRTGDGELDADEFAFVLEKFRIKEKDARQAFTLFSEANTKRVDLPYFKTLCYQYYLSEDPADLGNFITGKLHFDTEEEEK